MAIVSKQLILDVVKCLCRSDLKATLYQPPCINPSHCSGSEYYIVSTTLYQPLPICWFWMLHCINHPVSTPPSVLVLNTTLYQPPCINPSLCAGSECYIVSTTLYQPLPLYWFWILHCINHPVSTPPSVLILNTTLYQRPCINLSLCAGSEYYIVSTPCINPSLCAGSEYYIVSMSPY